MLIQDWYESLDFDFLKSIIWPEDERENFSEKGRFEFKSKWQEGDSHVNNWDTIL